MLLWSGLRSWAGCPIGLRPQPSVAMQESPYSTSPWQSQGPTPSSTPERIVSLASFTNDLSPTASSACARASNPCILDSTVLGHELQQRRTSMAEEVLQDLLRKRHRNGHGQVCRVALPLQYFIFGISGCPRGLCAAGNQRLVGTAAVASAIPLTGSHGLRRDADAYIWSQQHWPQSDCERAWRSPRGALLHHDCMTSVWLRHMCQAQSGGSVLSLSCVLGRCTMASTSPTVLWSSASKLSGLHEVATSTPAGLLWVTWAGLVLTQPLNLKPDTACPPF